MKSLSQLKSAFAKWRETRSSLQAPVPSELRLQVVQAIRGGTERFSLQKELRVGYAQFAVWLEQFPDETKSPNSEKKEPILNSGVTIVNLSDSDLCHRVQNIRVGLDAQTESTPEAIIEHSSGWRN